MTGSVSGIRHTVTSVPVSGPASTRSVTTTESMGFGPAFQIR